MTDTALQTPLAIDRVERSRGEADQVRLIVSGHWRQETSEEAGASDALLVVQLHGRRHRFPAAGKPSDADPGPGTERPFTVSFSVPDWAVPEQPGQAVLWVGDVVVPVPPPGTAPTAPISISRLAPPQSDPEPSPPASPAVVPGPGAGGEGSEASGSGRSGPLAELLIRETVSALHAELEERSAESAKLRSALAALRADLEGRTAARTELETAHAELREELSQLMGAASGQREDYEARLTAVRGERDHLAQELARSGEELARSEEELARSEEELARSAHELAAVREDLAGVRADLARIERDLAGAREELERARGAAEDRVATARSEFDQQLAGVRAEAEAALQEARREAAEAIAARERSEADGAAARRRMEDAATLARERVEAELTALRERTDAERERAAAELAATRAESEAMLGATRSHSETRASAAQREIRELSERIAALQSGERLRAEQVGGLREQLAASHISRDAARSEAEGLRDELDRLGSELGVLREQAGPPGGDLTEARQLLADARALTERLRGDPSP